MRRADRSRRTFRIRTLPQPTSQDSKHNLGLTPPHGVPDWLWTIVRYFKWLGTVLHGDFGYSTSNSQPVIQAILERLPATLELMVTSFVFSVVIGLSAGIFSAVRPYSFADYFITTFAFFGQSMPVFWFALMLQLAFAVHGIPLPGGYEIILPSAGLSSSDTFDLSDRISHLVLPVDRTVAFGACALQPLHAVVALGSDEDRLHAHRGS